MLSLSSRRAWIEIAPFCECLNRFRCRSPHGERGLKFIFSYITINTSCRSPHGERGLKYTLVRPHLTIPLSLSSRRAWIEIKRKKVILSSSICRSPHGERGLKSQIVLLAYNYVRSLSSRRAWIEIR